jgi:hypothetical protein
MKYIKDKSHVELDDEMVLHNYNIRHTETSQTRIYHVPT